MLTIRIPTHYEIKKAIKNLPFGEKVWFYNKNTKRISTGKLVGFTTSIYEHDDSIIPSLSIYSGTDIIVVPDTEMFTTEDKALKWAMTHLSLKDYVEAK